MVPHAHSGWPMSPFNSKGLSHVSNSAGQLSGSSSSIPTSSSFNFPPTPPKDGTPENVNAATEYTPESKPVKTDIHDNQSPSYSHTAHPMPTYPSYVTPGSDYAGSLGFHPGSMFKSTIPRPRTKTRSSAGRLFLFFEFAVNKFDNYTSFDFSRLINIESITKYI